MFHMLKLFNGRIVNPHRFLAFTVTAVRGNRNALAIIAVSALVGINCDGGQAAVLLDLLHTGFVKTQAEGNHNHNGGSSNDNSQNCKDGPKLPAPQTA